MKKPINSKKMLEEIVLALEQNPEADRLRMCPQCRRMHVVEHLGQDFCGTKCVDDYNNQKKKLDKLRKGGELEELHYEPERFLIEEDLYKLPSIEEMSKETGQLLNQIEKLQKENRQLKDERERMISEGVTKFQEGGKLLAEKDAIIAKQIESEKGKDAIIAEQSLRIQEFEKLTDQGKKDFILWCLVTGAIKTALLQSKGAIIDTWNGTAKLYGFNFIKKYMRDEYVLSPGQSIN